MTRCPPRHCRPRSPLPPEPRSCPAPCRNPAPLLPRARADADHVAAAPDRRPCHALSGDEPSPAHRRAAALERELGAAVAGAGRTPAAGLRGACGRPTRPRPPGAVARRAAADAGRRGGTRAADRRWRARRGAPGRPFLWWRGRAASGGVAVTPGVQRCGLRAGAVRAAVQHDAHGEATREAIGLAGCVREHVHRGDLPAAAAAQRISALLRALCPAARHETLDGLGHMGTITHPDAVNARIVRFMMARCEAVFEPARG